MKPQTIIHSYLWKAEYGFHGGCVWWNRMLTLDEKSRLDQLMGAALLEPEIAERLLRHDATLLERFEFSPLLRQWLLQTEAASIHEFARLILDKLKAQIRLITSHEDPSVVITPQEIQQAVHISLFSSKPDTDHPFQTLALVDEYLQSPYLPTSPLNRRLALQALLAQVITDEFKHHCLMFNLSIPLEMSSWEEAHRHIGLIAQRHNPRLSGWAWLYYRYVCIDLDISAASFAQLLHVDKRTLRRYQQNAFHQLAEHLIILESQAQLRAHTASLENQPISITVLF